MRALPSASTAQTLEKPVRNDDGGAGLRPDKPRFRDAERNDVPGAQQR